MFFLRVFFFLITVPVLLGGCGTLPTNTGNKVSYALQDTEETRFGVMYSELAKDHPEDSGFILLEKGLDAFAARLGLIRFAEKSIDVQYYMIHNDLTGFLFSHQLMKAADRGVRIRLLIDDMDLEGRDEVLSALAAHPDVALRVFNPFQRDSRRGAQLFTRFGSVTRRMHNKSFTVDNQITIVGGRNIGNEYFEADPDLAFIDLDLLAIGQVVKEVSISFDEYWNNSRAYPIDVLRPDLAEKYVLEVARKEMADYYVRDDVTEYLHSLTTSSNLIRAIRDEEVTWAWGKAKVLSDHPDKLESYETGENDSLLSQIHPFFENLVKEVLIFSPYFVPGNKGTEFFKNLSRSGVRVRILTNSLASTDVGIVHAGYAKYRKELLRDGVELYELNINFKSSQTSLHSKAFVLDRKRVFIGSLNLDPRSVTENTEIGIMLTSTEIVDSMVDIFDSIIEKNAFRLEMRVDEKGLEHLFWHGYDNDNKRVWTSDPHTGFWRRFITGLIGLLPIESQL